MGKREHSTWDIMANAKPEEERRHGTNMNVNLTNDSYKSTAIYNNVGGIWKECTKETAGEK